MLICATMTLSTKMCPSCKQTLDESEFSKGRVICGQCKTEKAISGISASYETYLRNLYSKSKSNVKRGMRGPEVTFEIEPEDVIALWEKQNGKCAISGVYLTHHLDGSGKKEYNASIDRISGDKGYTIHNVQLVCYRINIMKHTLSEDMFYWWIKTINDFSCD
jgi:uncharacterized Zn finger protein (UPF0148 family)